MFADRRTLAAGAFLAALLIPACAGPGPEGFPRPRFESADAPRRHYDLDRDGAAELRLHAADADAQVSRLEFADDPDVPFPPSDNVPHLLIIIDSVPFDLVEQARAAGNLRLFERPSRVVSPFPVMTDIALATLFDVGPLPGIEAQFLQGDALNDASAAYLDEENMIWTRFMDYRMEPLGHVFTYSDPLPWYRHELGRIESRGLAALRQGDSYVAYIVGTSAIGSHLGRNGHVAALREIEGLCLRVAYEMKGAVQITLMSDHGHSFVPSRYFSLADALRDLGYRIGTRRGPEIDAIVPEWGLVTCAAIYTEHAADIASGLVLLEGVEHCAYRHGDQVIVHGRTGSAAITRDGGTLTCRAITGDPLDVLEGAGTRTGTRTEWLDRTLAGDWPLAVPRLWDAFDQRFDPQPDLLVSIAPGYYVGSRGLHRELAMRATHGNLRPASSLGFIMSTAGRLPAGVAMRDVPAALARLGLGLPGRQPIDETPADDARVGRLPEQVEDRR